MFKKIFGVREEIKVLSPEDELQKILEVNTDLESIATNALMTGKKVSWHDVRNRVNSNARADSVCKKINDLGIPIIFQGQTFEKWDSWE